MTREDQSTVRVGILGTGYIADWHVKALGRLDRVQVVAAADVDLGRARSFAAAHGIGSSFAGLEAMLAGEQLDVVHILTPPQTHYATARQALDSGVHVLLEKPMCIAAHEAAELAEMARARGLQLGVNHNFLFHAEYERLRAALSAGAIGRIDHVAIVWNKPLGQLTAGPPDLWMLRAPQNIVLEIGPHLAAHLLDLVGYPESWDVRVENPLELAGGATFFRRWRITATRGKVAADLLMSFNQAFTEHYIHVRGSHGAARVDFENQTFTLDRPTRYGIDFDRYFRVRRAGKALLSQARQNVLDYVLAKFKLSGRGNAFGLSIERSLRAFYAMLSEPAGTAAARTEPRIAPRVGVDVVRFCCDVADRVRIAEPAGQASAHEATNGAVHNGASSNGTPEYGSPLYVAIANEATKRTAGSDDRFRATVLVLGGTGFIGRELVRQLVAQSYRVRVLSRSAANPGGIFEHPAVEMVRGSMSSADALESAMSGVDHVFHLARAHVKLWDDYYRLDVLGTRLVAETCLKAGVKRLFYTGTIDSYYAGGNAGTIREETGLDPQIHRRNYYARAKSEAEAVLLAMHREQQLPVVIFRPGIVLGAGGSPFHWGVGMWSGNAVCQLWGDGDNPLPIVLVADVAAALVSAIDAPGIEGQSFNLVGEPCLTGRQYLAELERCLDVKLDVLQTPIWKFYVTDMAKWCVKCLVRHPDRKLPSYRDWESRTQRASFDCSKAKQVLHWIPTTDRSQIIRDAIAGPAAELEA